MTLKLTLQNIGQIDPVQARGGTTIFYFTDNYATYCIAASGSSPSPRLHALIEEIRLLELRLECTLQAVHVPGVVMITQGTDGLSRGVWASPLHDLALQQVLTEAVFAPLAFDASLVHSVLYELHSASLLFFCYSDVSVSCASCTLSHCIPFQ
jgi:hypothetical protein